MVRDDGSRSLTAFISVIEWPRIPAVYLKDFGNIKIDEKDISKDLDKIKEQIKNQENVIANCDGIEITEEDADYLMKAIDLALHRIKQKNKEKYTPKKYK